MLTLAPWRSENRLETDRLRVKLGANSNPSPQQLTTNMEQSRDSRIMSLDQQDIEDIAVLARLQLDHSEIPEITQRITAILSMVDQMQSVNTENVEPMANPMDATQRLRADQITEDNQREQFQAIAPSAEKGLYLVPKVID